MTQNSPGAVLPTALASEVRGIHFRQRDAIRNLEETIRAGGRTVGGAVSNYKQPFLEASKLPTIAQPGTPGVFPGVQNPSDGGLQNAYVGYQLSSAGIIPDARPVQQSSYTSSEQKQTYMSPERIRTERQLGEKIPGSVVNSAFATAEEIEHVKHSSVFLCRERVEVASRVLYGAGEERRMLEAELIKLKEENEELDAMERVLEARVEYQKDRLDVLRKLAERRQGVSTKGLCFTLLDTKQARRMHEKEEEKGYFRDGGNDNPDASKYMDDSEDARRLLEFQKKTRKLFRMLAVLQEVWELENANSHLYALPSIGAHHLDASTPYISHDNDTSSKL